MKHLQTLFISSILFFCSTNAHALTVDYTLDNLFSPDGQITGDFTWTYDVDDFEGGRGLFSSINIPRSPGFFLVDITLDNISVSIDVSSIEITLSGPSLDSDGLDILLLLETPLNPLQGSNLILTAPVGTRASTYSSGQSGQKFPFFSGSIALASPAPVVTPIPAAGWLFGTFLIGFIGTARHKRSAKV